jgi:ATP-binding protein involved in chromosome partitioning
MNPAHLPDDVAPNADGTRLVIRWRDGVETSYAPRALRLACPCAGCVEEMTGRPLLVPETVASDVHPRSIEYVGRYALRFVWSDGHSTGIYPFEFLRRLADEGRGG